MTTGDPGFEKPTKVRNGVIWFAVMLSVITYLDRVAMSISRKQVASDLHLNDAQMGYVFSAFAVAYAVFEIPSGFLGDRLGPRNVLLRIVIWWSLFTAMTGRVWNLASLVTTQFLFGAGEAGCFPNIARAFSIWLPKPERVRAQGIIWFSARMGGAFTPLLVTFFLLKYMDWRNAFAVLGLLGVGWAIAFALWFRDNPRDNKNINAAELELLKDNAVGKHSGMPWGALVTSKTVWLLSLQYFSLSFSWYFLITWAPTFIDERFHLDVTKSTFLKVLPLMMGAIGALLSGMIAAPVARWTGSVKTARRLVACTGFVGASCFLILAAQLNEPYLAVPAIALSSFCNDLIMPPAWGTVMDISGRYSGTVAGTMNMMGNLGGALYGSAAGLVLEYTHRDWNAVLYMGAAVYLLGFIAWLVIDPVTEIQWGKEQHA